MLPYPAEKMDIIFNAMYRQRTIQTYGGKLTQVDDDFDTDVATVFTKEIRENSVIWNWEQECKTWIDYNTGEMRTY